MVTIGSDKQLRVKVAVSGDELGDLFAGGYELYQGQETVELELDVLADVIIEEIEVTP